MAAKQLQRKIIGVPLQKEFERTSEGFLLVRGIFTSDMQDEVGDIITRAATERAMPKYRLWGNIRRMHNPDPVGRVKRIGSADGLAWNEVEILVIDPKAIFEVENGLLQALSVGCLIDLNDVEMLANGCWLINDYQLAEISLVDHPANYDARLVLSLNLDTAARTLAREQGLFITLRSMGVTPPEEENMEKTTEEILEAAAAEVVVVVPEEVQVPEVPAEAVAEAAVEVVAEVAEVVAEALVVPEVEEVPVTAEPETPAAVEASIDSTADQIKKALAPLTEAMKVLQATLASFAETQKALTAQVPVAPVQPQGNAEVTEDPRDAKIKALELQVEELSTPANRKGLMPETEIPTEVAPSAVAADAQPEPVAKPKSLREAVQRYAEAKTRK